MKETLLYLWSRRTTVLGYAIVILGVLATAQDLFTERQLKWVLLINGILTAILGHYNNSKNKAEESKPPQNLFKDPRDPEGGFARPLLLALLLAFSAPVMVAMHGCAVPNPVAVAETNQQRAYALWGSYVIVKEQAAKIYQDADTPTDVKEILRAANNASTPTFNSLYEALIFYKTVEDELKAGKTTEEQWLIASQSLADWYFKAKPILADFQAAYDKVKK